MCSAAATASVSSGAGAPQELHNGVDDCRSGLQIFLQAVLRCVTACSAPDALFVQAPGQCAARQRLVVAVSLWKVMQRRFRRFRAAAGRKRRCQSVAARHDNARQKSAWPGLA